MNVTRCHRPRRALLALTVTPGSSAGLVAATSDSAGAAPAASGGGAWTGYHQDLLGAGVTGGTTSLAGAHHAWTSPTLHGQLDGEPTDNRLSTPSVGDGLLLAPAASSIVAFEG